MGPLEPGPPGGGAAASRVSPKGALDAAPLPLPVGPPEPPRPDPVGPPEPPRPDLVGPPEPRPDPLPLPTAPGAFPLPLSAAANRAVSASALAASAASTWAWVTGTTKSVKSSTGRASSGFSLDNKATAVALTASSAPPGSPAAAVNATPSSTYGHTRVGSCVRTSTSNANLALSASDGSASVQEAVRWLHSNAALGRGNQART